MPAEEPHRRLFGPWLAFAVLCVVSMVAFPGEETIPLHLGWFALGLAYGFDPWRLPVAASAVAGYAVLSGTVLVLRAGDGVIAAEETAEIPLMAALVILMIWHVGRRQEALASVRELRARERRRAERREHTARLISHEIRTTLTIAGGYLDLVLHRELTAPVRRDLEIARDELGRLNRASDRLIRIMRLQEERRTEPVDLDALLAQTAERWASVADRDWRCQTQVGRYRCDPGRMRACLDTLVENSLRHTERSGTVRLFAVRIPGHLCLGVADSGPGFTQAQLAAVNLASRPVPAGDVPAAATGSGLGLSIVRQVASGCGGRLAAGRSAEGGALVVLVLPLDQAAAEAGGTEPALVALSDRTR